MADKRMPTTRAASRNKAAASTASTSSTPTPPPVPAKTTRSRAAAASAAVAAKSTKKVASATVKPSPANAIPKKKVVRQEEEATEPIMAFLRVRPHLSDDPPPAPYLRCVSETTVSMSDPSNRTHSRASSVAPPATYSFTRVFSDATQAEFFAKTTLPLVKNVLHGQNALLFAYGATNAGKTYTMQGGAAPETAGILPRAIDVLFNSTEGLRSNAPKYKPTRLHGVEKASVEDVATAAPTPEPLLTEVIGQLDSAFSGGHVDPTTVTVDHNYEFSIWISYAEVYNDKVYDLLDSLQESRMGKVQAQRSRLPHHVLRQALTLKPSPPSDDEPPGKYISGLRQYLVKTAAEAKSLINLGQLHRRVYGTLANSASSRSHGMVFIKVLRGHRGERNDPSALQVARLTLVDLAGSERTKYTQATGDRLKEAGNINNSLMVLGQCLETLRSNQRKVGMSLSPEGASRVDTRDVKKGLAIVPFRHSRLTEILQDYFVGDARAAMIVNVNPYDTGYDENSHVMKFAALAREVLVAPAPAPVQRVPHEPEGVPGPKKGKPSQRLNPPDIVPRRKVTISTGTRGNELKNEEAVIEVTELDEAHDDEDAEDEYPANPLVDALFEEIDRLRLQIYELELHCAETEAITRAEVMEEMEGQMGRMERLYEKRLRREVDRSNNKMDEKIDMLVQTGVLGSPVKPSFAPVPRKEQYESDDESGEDDSRPPSPSRKGKTTDYSTLSRLAEGVASMTLKVQ